MSNKEFKILMVIWQEEGKKPIQRNAVIALAFGEETAILN